MGVGFKNREFIQTDDQRKFKINNRSRELKHDWQDFFKRTCPHKVSCWMKEKRTKQPFLEGDHLS